MNAKPLTRWVGDVVYCISDTPFQLRIQPGAESDLFNAIIGDRDLQKGSLIFPGRIEDSILLFRSESETLDEGEVRNLRLKISSLQFPDLVILHGSAYDSGVYRESTNQ